LTVAALPLLDSLSALADPTRCRMLLLLERHELTVSELCAVLQLPQSSVSRQLKTLADASWVTSRRDGTSRYYSLLLETADTQTLWQLTRGQLEGKSATAQDVRRLERVLAARRAASEQFFASVSGKWDKLRDELFGDDFAFRAMAGLLDDEWTVADLGCGTGSMTAVLAPHVKQVIGVDASEEMLDAAKSRLASATNIEFRKGSLEALPVFPESVDAATLMLVLHHLPSPADALSEAARILKPGGRVLIVDMAPHEKDDYRRQMGHVWLGFSEEQMKKMLAAAGFTKVKLHALPPAHSAKGPALFMATGKKA
jgi:ubiquinone/menaquinone biosynthesis C-methylase UbiE/DNA-binding transcriptional ArsR family regulator